MDYLIHHPFIRNVRRSPGKTAVQSPDRSLSYEALSERAGALLEQLNSAGVEAGDRIAFYLDHDVDQAVAILATSAAGGIFVPVNRLLYPDQVRHILEDSGAKVLITQEDRYDRLSSMIQEMNSLEETLLLDDIGTGEPLIKTNPVIEEDLAALLYTSGSTGPPKGVMVTHRNLLAGCEIVCDYLRLRSSDNLLGLLQLSFDYGLNQLLSMLYLGGTYTFFTFNFPNDIVDALQKYEITGVAGIPTIWAGLRRSRLSETHLPHLRFITNSGGAVPTEIVGYLQEALPATDIILMYGLTEAFRSTYLPAKELDGHEGSIGRPIPNTDIYILNESGEPCAPGEVGELVHRGPTVAKGYWNRPEETREVFRPNPLKRGGGDVSERVVFSGDLAEYDRDGFLYFVGRKNAMIKSAGVRISPWEIEEVLFKSGLVLEAAAIGVPSDMMGEVIKAYVVPLKTADNSDSRVVEKLNEFCARHMPRYMIPKEIRVVDEIPKTHHGKNDYNALVEREL